MFQERLSDRRDGNLYKSMSAVHWRLCSRTGCTTIRGEADGAGGRAVELRDTQMHLPGGRGRRDGLVVSSSVAQAFKRQAKSVQSCVLYGDDYGRAGLVPPERADRAIDNTKKRVIQFSNLPIAIPLARWQRDE